MVGLWGLCLCVCTWMAYLDMGKSGFTVSLACVCRVGTPPAR